MPDQPHPQAMRCKRGDHAWADRSRILPRPRRGEVMIQLKICNPGKGGCCCTRIRIKQKPGDDWTDWTPCCGLTSEQHHWGRLHKYTSRDGTRRQRRACNKCTVEEERFKLPGEKTFCHWRIFSI